MKTTRNTDQTGGYTVCGYTKDDNLVAYTVTREGSGWSTIGWFVSLVYGKGEDFTKRLFATKAEAVKAINNQG